MQNRNFMIGIRKYATLLSILSTVVVLTNAQVTIKERVQIVPGLPQHGSNRPLNWMPVPTYYVIPSAGTLAVQMDVQKWCNVPPPTGGYVTIRINGGLHDTTYIMRTADYTPPPTLGYVALERDCPPSGYVYVPAYERNGGASGQVFYINNVYALDTLRSMYYGVLALPLNGVVKAPIPKLSMMIDSTDSCYNQNDGHMFGLEACTLTLTTPATGFAGFKLMNDADTISYGGATAVRAIAVNNTGSEVYVDGGTQVRFGAGAARFGKYIRPAGDTIAPPIFVNYSDARSGKVSYTSDPTIISDTIQTSVDTALSTADTSKHGNGRVVISSGWTIYRQGNPNWRTDTLDNSSIGETIWHSGCALSCLAMVLTRWHYLYDPGSLNVIMDQRGFFDANSRLSWHTPDSVTNSVVYLGQFSGKSWRSGGSPVSLSSLDASLGSANISTIVEVMDSTLVNGAYRRCSHYVIVIGKNESGQYVTLDPKYQYISTLQMYGGSTNPKGQIYSIIRYFRKAS